MRRRNFLKGLATLALAPIAAVASTSKAISPANVETPLYNMSGEQWSIPVEARDKKEEMYVKAGDLMVNFKCDATEMIRACKEAMAKMAKVTDRAAKATKELNFALNDVYFSPEALEDIRTWGVDEIDDKTCTAIFMNGHAVDGYGYDMKGEPKPNRNGNIYPSVHGHHRRNGIIAHHKLGEAVLDNRRIKLKEWEITEPIEIRGGIHPGFQLGECE
jgi:hypothetical protein